MTAVLCVAAYLLIAAAYLVSNHRWNRMQAARVRRLRKSYPACVPVPAPATPPFTQTTPDPSWFAGMPVEILSDDAVRSLFDELINMEGLS